MINCINVQIISAPTDINRKKRYLNTSPEKSINKKKQNNCTLWSSRRDYSLYLHHPESRCGMMNIHQKSFIVSSFILKSYFPFHSAIFCHYFLTSEKINPHILKALLLFNLLPFSI